MPPPYRVICVLIALLCASPGVSQAQNPRLTELLAVNVTGLQDQDATAQPWIEIWNPNVNSKVIVTSYKLTDGTTTWTFPSWEIPPDERVVIFASGKNRTLATAPVHTNFTLNPAGGTLSLLNSGNTVISQLVYPAQETDVSWGRDEWDTAVTPSVVGKYSNPTPGARNNYSGPGVSGNVVVSEPSKAYTGVLNVSLSLAQPDPEGTTTIRYTLNGQAPTATTGTLYEGPVGMTTTAMLRARSFKTGLLPGEIETAGYLLLNATTQNFTSLMPLAVISNFNGNTPPDTTDQSSFIWVWEPAAPDNLAKFTNLPVLASRSAIDRRGSSTLGNPKHNLNLEFRKSRDDDDTDRVLMGMPTHSDWVFHAPYSFDPGRLHNPFIYALSNSIGRYASRSVFAEVFIDTNGGPLVSSGVNATTNDYYGIYNVMEKIRRDGQRVDIEVLNTYDNDAVSKTGGLIWKIDRLDSGDSGFGAGGQAWAYYYPKEVDLKSPQRDPQEQSLTQYLNSANTALQSATWNNPVTGYAAWMDVGAAVDHHLLNVWAFNVDALRLSGYWHKERGGKIVAGPIWDFDRALWSTDGRDSNPAVWRSPSGDLGTDFFNYPWWTRLFRDPDFYQKYVDRWQDLRRTGGAFSQVSVNALLDSLNAKMSAEAVARDLTRWGNGKRSFTTTLPPIASYTGQTAEVQRMKEFLQRRANFFDTQWVGPVTTSIPGGVITPGTQVTLTGPASSVIYYTLNGADPRASGGLAAIPEALTYDGTPITIDASTRLRARAFKSAHTALTGANNPPLVCKWSGLTNNLYTTDRAAAPGDLVVTEVNYHPADPKPAELISNPVLTDNDFEFLELRNVSADTVNLAGVQIADAVTFTFTGDQSYSIPAGGYVVVASSPAAFALRYPGFAGMLAGPWTGNLSNSGESLRVLAANTNKIFEMSWLDTWEPESDGPGKSLAVFNARGAEASFSTAANWRASAAADGSPGAGEPNRAPAVTIAPVASASVTAAALTGSAQDDGLPEPPAPLTYAWTKVSGPGDVTFETANAASTNAQFTLPGAYVLKLSSGDGVLTGEADVSVPVRDTFAAWSARHPGAGGATEDLDFDGVITFAEFALGTDPAVPEGSPVAARLAENGRLIVEYRRAKSTLSIVLEVSDGNDAFRAANPGEFTETITGTDGVFENVRITENTAGPQSSKFVRLRITVSS